MAVFKSVEDIVVDALSASGVKEITSYNILSYVPPGYKAAAAPLIVVKKIGGERLLTAEVSRVEVDVISDQTAKAFSISEAVFDWLTRRAVEGDESGFIKSVDSLTPPVEGVWGADNSKVFRAVFRIITPALRDF